MIKIGITGSLASGKTTASKILSFKRGPLFSADKTVKELYQNKGSETYYRVYNSGFGTDGEYYMVAIAAKDQEHMVKKGNINKELFGEEGQKKMWEMYQNVLKYEKVEADMRPDLAYASK